MKQIVPGTKGYSDITGKFIDATIEIDFLELHRDFLPFIPSKPCSILDIGAGIGRDASILYEMGHSVKAVEPTREFRLAGKQLYGYTNIEWIDDCLPKLELLGNQSFDFILASGVWHHLDSEEQHHSLLRVVQLLNFNGIFALTLRHGPAGAGIHTFPTNGKQTVKEAENCGLKTLLFYENLPSLMKNKKEVTWTKLVFQKTENFVEV